LPDVVLILLKKTQLYLKNGIMDNEKDTQNEQSLIPDSERSFPTIFKVYLGPPIFPPCGYREFYLGWREGEVDLCEQNIQ